jgi:hypothetical protein
MDGCMGGWMGEWIDRWVGGWMDGWIDGWVDGWVDGWMDELTASTPRLLFLSSKDLAVGFVGRAVFKISIYINN